MKVDDFDFELPREAIADRPARPRDAARLLRVEPDRLADLIVRDLPTLLEPGDLMVFNDTKVIPARLKGRRGTAGISVTLHQPVEGDSWLAFARPAKKLAAGDRLRFAEDFSAEVAEKGEAGEVLLRFDRGGADLMTALALHGEMPLPPYIKRPNGADDRDRDDYQTVYAREPGAVAAPTAGLHFTPDLLAALDRRGIGRETLTLHVGAGTFLPVKVDDTRDHKMHSERGHISAEAAERINRVRQAGGRVVAVGTTALRLLESASSEEGRLSPFDGSTDIFITPGYRFRMVDLLMTNFHLPRSTLFMLVSAFAGLDRMRSAYAHAIQTGYRFYSYGDTSLLTRQETRR
ncbi:tRNA preQ1(34) S-adenosylmethionine ribosyltransferase-isomerase QueA [Telmatospirillum siberiense]|uniref:S-adenosylmethionine:tRNA ribosyltransferase-isomerase n=1 Tax=Telmatospirillum siberiense TaxID=382514 RepID=A0A2N3PPD5_9PROT|nr:tRNA preQ1(34) S-adenosylmethionine ribosyltransferase-isomerase QueA [Telmatospirillum siberiense]PKU22283.1 tRNA preQ1(34) S-adenosylmethionine ribosyltransferase-isomerase QueA [Telmatospirillum siberiense]